jgi:hypothetical protein
VNTQRYLRFGERPERVTVVPPGRRLPEGEANVMYDNGSVGTVKTSALENRTGTTFLCDRPCPRCGHMTVIGYLLVNEDGEHMHTRYVCTFWQTQMPRVLGQCDWAGWTVPGWDQGRDEAE